MPVFALQPAFSRGEISPRLWARADISHYALALKECTNFTVMRQGGLTRRTGTEFINEVKNSSQRVRLIDFVFSTEQAYVLEFGHLYMRVYANGGVVVSGGTPVEIATPYTEDQIFDLHYVQSADVLFVAHPAHAPRKISRTSDTDWTIETFAFKDGPYLELNDTATTLTPSDYGSLTPRMTSNTTPSGTVISTGSEPDAYDAFDKDASTGVSWDVAPSGFIGYRLASGSAIVDHYWLTAPNGDEVDRMPVNWVVEGSNNGSTWIPLDSRQGEGGWTGGETRFYEFANKTAFSYYRLSWTGLNGADPTVETVAQALRHRVEGSRLQPEGLLGVESAPRLPRFAVCEPMLAWRDAQFAAKTNVMTPL